MNKNDLLKDVLHPSFEGEQVKPGFTTYQGPFHFCLPPEGQEVVNLSGVLVVGIISFFSLTLFANLIRGFVRLLRRFFL